jgi:nicotinate phosphoribosyltransferase
MAAGLEQALEFLEDLRFAADEIDWLKDTGRFSARTLAYLSDLRFTGDVHAMPEMAATRESLERLGIVRATTEAVG